jgi:type I restriction enzyme S subunit
VVEAKEEWEEGKLGDFVIETVGGEWGKENPEGDFTKAVQCIRGTDIADLNVGLASKTPIRFVKESKFEKIESRNGDIIMEISGGTENQSTGRVAYVNEDVKTLFQYPIVFSNFCRLLRVDEKYSYFLYCYLRYLYDQDEYFNLENGSSGIKNLDYKALLYDLTYPMPKDKRLIFEFNDNVSLYFKKINRNKQQIQTLIQTRDGLLPRVMNKEISM